MKPTMIVAPRGRGIATVLVDCEVMTLRNLRTLVRVPQMMLAVTLQPLMFVLLFSYVFGEALGGEAYRQFLVGGIMTQSVAFNAAFSALGLAADKSNGVTDRFMALPMSRSAMVAGRTLSDVVVNVITLVVISVAGLIIGWRLHGSIGGVLGGYAIALLFGLAMSWIGAVVGLVSVSAQAAQSLLMTVLFPVAFISSAFIPSKTLPTPLRLIANWNPVTSVARSLREAFGNPTAVGLANEPVTWASEHPQLYSVLVSVAVIAVVAPLVARAVRRGVRTSVTN